MLTKKIFFTAVAISLTALCVSCAGTFDFGGGNKPMKSEVDKKISAAKKTLATEKYGVRPLEGKLICIDPGHGNDEFGAVGPKGLKEKDINLSVSMFLKEMLEKDGAKVIMTRTGDEQVGIIARAKFNKANKTDLFVSIHHNANAQNDSSMNRSEMFFHWKDRGGPSEDVSILAMREMQAAKKFPDSKVYMCWAYGVLRENSYPAFLGEFSYLANPDEEKRLRDPEYLRMEASTYYKAIKKFFTGGRPKLEFADDKSLEHGMLNINVNEPENTALIDPQGISVWVNEESVHDFYYDKSEQKIVGRINLDNRDTTQTVIVTASNLEGHNSDLLMKIIPPEKKNKKTAQKNMGALKDLKIISKDFAGKKVILDEKDFYIPQTKSKEIKIFADGFRYEEISKDKIKRGSVALKPMFGAALRGKTIVVDPEGGGDFPCAIGENGLRASDANLKVALYLYNYLKTCGANVSITRDRDMSMDNVSRVRFGLLRNPDVFLSIGHRLPEAGMDEKAGMNVSRIGDRWDEGNIGKNMIFHLRQLLGTGEGLGDVKSKTPLKGEIHNWSSWEVMHAAEIYTAIYVSPQMFDLRAVQERLTTTAGCRKEAIAMLYGLLQYFGLKEEEMGCVEGIALDEKTQKPIGDALIWLDDSLPFQTESDGKFILKYLEKGRHKLSIQAFGYLPQEREIKIDANNKINLEIKL